MGTERVLCWEREAYQLWCSAAGPADRQQMFVLLFLISQQEVICSGSRFVCMSVCWHDNIALGFISISITRSSQCHVVMVSMITSDFQQVSCILVLHRTSHLLHNLEVSNWPHLPTPVFSWGAVRQHHFKVFLFWKPLQWFSIPFSSLNSAGSLLCVQLPVDDTEGTEEQRSSEGSCKPHPTGEALGCHSLGSEVAQLFKK